MGSLRKIIAGNRILMAVIRPFYCLFTRKRDFSSRKYWEKRYASGGNSGAGSYGRLARFKADVVNDFVKWNKIKSVVELGCGDGHQLAYFDIPRYVGLDVSKESIRLCKARFSRDKSKSFFLYGPDNLVRADAALSLDVIYPLVEDDVFERYMRDLFSSSKRYVIIYSSDTDKQERFQAQHVKHRKFSDFIRDNFPDWELISTIKNKFPVRNDPGQESFADFYIYKKS
jgi:SAM-dependent methyltransferase